MVRNVPKDSDWERINPLYSVVEVHSEEGIFNLTELARLVIAVVGDRFARRAFDIVWTRNVADGM